MNKIPVSERAVTARLRRALAKDGKKLCACRPNSRWYGDFGDWYIVTLSNNALDSTHCDLEGWARELGVMKPYEVMDADVQP